MASTLQRSPGLLAGMVTKPREIDRQPLPGAARFSVRHFGCARSEAVRVLDCATDFKMHPKASKLTRATEERAHHATHSQHRHLPKEARRFSDCNLPGRRDRDRCDRDDRPAAGPADW